MIIGIYSSYPQSGKSTVREMLMDIDKKYHKLNLYHESFGAKIKESLFVIFQDADFDIYPYLYGDKKSELIPGLNLTGGQLMSRYAMWWRQQYSNIWVVVANIHNDGLTCVVDDLRFPNEMKFVDFSIRVINPNVNSHSREKSSEGNLDEYDFDYTVYNDGSLDDLYNKVSDLYNWLDYEFDQL